MKPIVAVDGGTYFHRKTLYEAPYAEFFDDIIYAPDLAQADLSNIGCLFVTSRQSGELMANAKENIARYLAKGGFVVAMGETEYAQWLPNIDWHPTEVNFWWWLDKDADSGLVVNNEQHSLFNYLSLADATWHQHGYFNPPNGADSLISIQSKGSVLYEDRVSTPGRIIVTTLDPCYHHGSYFMPSTTKFLAGFLPWLRAELSQQEN